MVTRLKHFEVWATSLKSNLFTWARIKLSAMYMLIIAVILILFTLSIYASFKDRLGDRARDTSGYSIEDRSAYDRALDDIKQIALIADGSVFVIAAFLSYVLAGYTLAPIKEALDAQVAFAADASHELRTPLTVIRTNTEIILKNPPDSYAMTKRLLEVNLEEIDSITSMANQLLALARGQNTSNRVFQKVDLRQLVKDEVGKLENVAVSKSIQLVMKDSPEIFTEGDYSSLARMVKNILANAITYNVPGGAVTVELKVQSDRAVLIISDTGFGIPKNDIPHIFKRFYKVDHARTDTESGSGLGLAIVKQIIDFHSGSIEIKSSIGIGTSVIISLPRAT